jgi:hypothetical protein
MLQQLCNLGFYATDGREKFVLCCYHEYRDLRPGAKIVFSGGFATTATATRYMSNTALWKVSLATLPPFEPLRIGQYAGLTGLIGHLQRGGTFAVDAAKISTYRWNTAIDMPVWAGDSSAPVMYGDYVVGVLDGMRSITRLSADFPGVPVVSPTPVPAPTPPPAVWDRATLLHVRAMIDAEIARLAK